MNMRVALYGVGILCVAVAVGVTFGFGGIQNDDRSSDSISSDTVTEQTTQSSQQPNSGRPPQLARVSISPFMDSKNDTSIGVEIDTKAYGYNNLSYSNLRLCIYDEEGTVLANKSVGELRSPENGIFAGDHMINATLDEPPKYVIVDHPQLRNDSRVEIENRELVDDVERWDFLWRESGNLDEAAPFEFPRTNEVGKCG